jgi:hypothetical protein
MIMALGSLLAAGVLSMLKLNPEAPDSSLAADQPEAGDVRTDLKSAIAHGR